MTFEPRQPSRSSRVAPIGIKGHDPGKPVLTAVRTYNFDLLAYPRLPEGAPGTPIPSTFFDPAVGASNYREHIDEMAYCEELGFDGVMFNEHHYSAYGTMPSPNLIAAALSQRTNKMRIGVLGNILPLRSHPVRVAEEYAMLDCLTNGRLIAGFVRGVPGEYLWYNVDPRESRGRFEEAYELIMTAWTQPTWSYDGQFFHFHDCALWPRPVQQPHPPVWVAARSAESIEWCAARRIPIAQVYQSTGQIADTFGYYRKVAGEAGWDPPSETFILCRHIHVADSDDQARNVLEPALRYFFTLLNRGFNDAGSERAVQQREVLSALYSDRSMAYFRPENRERINFAQLGWDDLEATGYVICGSPDTVARKLKQQMSEIGADQFMGLFHVGNMPHSSVVSSLELFSREVLPSLRG